MPFNSSRLKKYIDKKVQEIDSAIEEKTPYLKIIQDKLDYYDLLLRRRNALSVTTQYLKENGGFNDEMNSMLHSIIRSLIFDIDSENVAAKKEFNLKRKTVVESEVEFLKKRKQEVLDLKNLY